MVEGARETIYRSNNIGVDANPDIYARFRQNSQVGSCHFRRRADVDFCGMRVLSAKLLLKPPRSGRGEPRGAAQVCRSLLLAIPSPGWLR